MVDTAISGDIDIDGVLLLGLPCKISFNVTRQGGICSYHHLSLSALFCGTFVCRILLSLFCVVLTNIGTESFETLLNPHPGFTNLQISSLAHTS